MSNVTDLNEYRRKKKEKKAAKEHRKGNTNTYHGYDGKLADAMRKYGSATGNVMSKLFKKKEKLEEKEENDL